MSCLLRSLALVSEDNNVAFTSALALRAKASADKSSLTSVLFSDEATWDEAEYLSFICSIRSERSSLLRVRSLMMAWNSCLRCSSRALFTGTVSSLPPVCALFPPAGFDADSLPLTPARLLRSFALTDPDNNVICISFAGLSVATSVIKSIRGSSVFSLSLLFFFMIFPFASYIAVLLLLASVTSPPKPRRNVEKHWLKLSTISASSTFISMNTSSSITKPTAFPSPIMSKA
mmetsp:Transcript_19092/g.34509  ORF Transcript_19092/g.34509 Transcript_19092/m.34509 type:complete len:232 (+) Transcript_19092:451-1146(+)